MSIGFFEGGLTDFLDLLICDCFNNYKANESGPAQAGLGPRRRFLREVEARIPP